MKAQFSLSHNCSLIIGGWGDQGGVEGLYVVSQTPTPNEVLLPYSQVLIDLEMGHYLRILRPLREIQTTNKCSPDYHRVVLKLSGRSINGLRMTSNKRKMYSLSKSLSCHYKRQNPNTRPLRVDHPR